MARRAEGWKIRKPEGRDTYEVRFTHNGRRVERSTGTGDPEEAQQAAARIYADYVQREPERRRAVRRGDSPPITELVATWLASDSTIAPRTVETWTTYGGHWARKWESLVHVTDVTCTEYRNERLRHVIADTVRKELGALRRFLGWCQELGYLTRKVEVPTIPKKTSGTRYGKRRRVSAPELSPDEIEAMLAALPEWSDTSRLKPENREKARFPIRARFVVGYDTGLRPTFLDDLEAPTHYQRGDDHIRIFQEVDKNRYQREVPLTARARKALDSVCPDIGPIFGKHDYRAALKKVAMAALPLARARVFNGAHFRSAAATHALELTGNVPGTMHMFGWKLVGTASKYTKASRRAADAVVRALDAERQAKTKQRPASG